MGWALDVCTASHACMMRFLSSDVICCSPVHRVCAQCHACMIPTPGRRSCCRGLILSRSLSQKSEHSSKSRQLLHRLRLFGLKISRLRNSVESRTVRSYIIAPVQRGCAKSVQDGVRMCPSVHHFFQRTPLNAERCVPKSPSQRSTNRRIQCRIETTRPHGPVKLFATEPSRRVTSVQCPPHTIHTKLL